MRVLNEDIGFYFQGGDGEFMIVDRYWGSV